jgi:hypothetical protein
MPGPSRIKKKFFLAAKRCPRNAWLLRNQPGTQELSLAQQFRIDQGIEIGVKARELFPEGVLIEQKATEEAAQKTQELLINPAIPVIFEATFLHGEYAAKADILIRTKNGWELIEIKSATARKVVGTNGRPKDPKTNKDLSDLVDDMAYTALVIGKNGLALTKISLVLVAETFELGMDLEKLFASFDFTAEVKGRVAEFEVRLEPVAVLLAAPDEPAFRLINDCKKCDFFAQCIPLPDGYTIFDVPRLQEKQLLDLYGKGIVLVQDIPQDYPPSDTQKVPVECMRSGIVIVDAGLPGELAKIRWPAHYLDFETTQTAYPLYEKVKPYEMIATQYSVHTCTGCGDVLHHREYLADPARDCRKDLAEQLIRDLDGDGSVLSYSSYEEQVIKGLIVRYPDLKEPLTAILTRIVDLIACSKCVNHPEFRGSNSIKKVLPVLVPEMSYDGLPIANGEDAMVTFALMAQRAVRPEGGESPTSSEVREEKNPQDSSTERISFFESVRVVRPEPREERISVLRAFTPEECAEKREQMLRYCELDTLAMVKIHEVFERMGRD